MKFLFLFLDGVGLGADDPASNPFAAAPMPRLTALLGGRKLLADGWQLPITAKRATLLALDACLGVAGRPQSASGQATLLTGRNIPAELGEHYGPRPNPAIRRALENGNLFSKLHRAGRQAHLLNAFPERYFQQIDSGRRLPGAIAMAVRAAGIPLKTKDDLFAGRALSADFTARGWRTYLNFPDTPLLTPEQAGARLAALTEDFAFFEYWLSDYAGHRREMESARQLLATLDAVLGGLLDAWDDEAGLILITSDHGNLEDLSTRQHTRNPVPAIVIGAPHLREAFSRNLRSLADVAPAILSLFAGTNSD